MGFQLSEGETGDIAEDSLNDLIDLFEELIVEKVAKEGMWDKRDEDEEN